MSRIDHMRLPRMFSFPDNMAKLITRTMITWAKTDFIYDRTLVGQMFSLIHRQYDGVGEVRYVSMYSCNDYHNMSAFHYFHLAFSTEMGLFSLFF